MIFLYIGIGIIVLLFVLLIIIHHNVFYTPIRGQNNEYDLTGPTLKVAKKEDIYKMIDDLKSVPFEEAWILSKDKKKLFARKYVNKNSDKVAIMCHGYRGTSLRDFSGGAKMIIDLGLNVLLIDERGHGRSEGHSTTFGRKEKYDVLKWIEYAKKEFGEDKKIILVGISMGAATSLYVSEYIEGAKIIADCPYNTPKEVIMNFMKKSKLPAKFLYPFVLLSSLIISGANINKENASRSVSKGKNKILIIHGEDDTLVPYKFSHKIYEDNPDQVTYSLYPKAEHGLAFIIDKPRYIKEVKDFIFND